MEIPKFKYLSITGDISVEPVTTRIPRDPYPCLYLIMGPTGAGKSSFIEAFAGKSQKLSISKDQLAGYTQTVTAYRLVNVVHREYNEWRPVYLIDTPGFSDSKISEIEVVNMVKQWSQRSKLYYSYNILYLIPITDTRLPGSRRRTFNMLKGLCEDYGASLIIITTMWDTVHNKPTRHRVKSNFAQLRNNTLKEFVRRPGTDIIKFVNTKNSALLAINRKFDITNMFAFSEAPTSTLLYQDLHERILGALQEKKMIESELAQPEVETNLDLQATFQRDQRENHKKLTKFINQFANFGELPPECWQAAYSLRNSIMATNVRPTNKKPRTLFGRELEPVICMGRSSDGTVWVRLSNDTADLLKDRGRLALDASKRHVAKFFKRQE